jgi:hypothetical protein
MAYAVPVPPGQPPAPRKLVPRAGLGVIRVDGINSGDTSTIRRALALLKFGDDADEEQ